MPVCSSVILTVYSLMIPFCWLVGGGDQERTKEVELTLAATSFSGGALGAEKKIVIPDVTKMCMLGTSCVTQERKTFRCLAEKMDKGEKPTAAGN